MKFVSIILLLLANVCAFSADAKPAERLKVTYSVQGLFSPDRVDDFRAALKQLPEIEIVDVDYENAEATLSYVPTSPSFKVSKPAQIRERMDGLLRGVTHGTFGLKPLYDKPRETLKQIEIPVGGLDCKGCALGTYWTIYKIDGVEHARVSFKEGWLKAAIDPTKISREALIAALKKKEGIVIKEEPQK